MAKNLFKVGNPGGGRKKINPDIKKAFALACPDAVQVILSLMNNSRDDKVRLKAAEIILERHLGKAVQPIGGPDGGDIVVRWKTE